MKEQYWAFFVSLYKDIPQSVYLSMAFLSFVGAGLLTVVYGFGKGTRRVAGLLLAEYVFLLYSSTIIFRPTSEQISGYDYHPFWSYRAILRGESQLLLIENIMNVVAFVPLGFLIGTQIAKIKQKGWFVAFLVGAGISASIEFMQLVLKRGFAEMDDVIHNTAGCLIGYGVYCLAIGMIKKRVT